MRTSIICIFLITFVLQLTSRECLHDAYKHYENNEYQKSIKGMMACLSDIEDEADPKELDYTYFGLASNYLKLGQMDSSLKYTLIAYNIEKMYELPTSKTLNQLGNLYINKGLNHQAIYYLKKAAEINKAEDNQAFLQKNYNNLGNAYNNLNFIDSSQKFYDLALRLTDVEDPEYSLILNNQASLHFKAHEIEKASKTLEKLNSKQVESNSNLEKYLFSSNLVLFKMFNEKKATYEDSLELNNYLSFSKKNNAFYYADANYKYSVFLLLSNKIKEAVSILNIANSLYIENGNIIMAKEITSNFSSLLYNKNIKGIKYSNDELNKMQIQQYSESLNKEIETRLEAENYILSLNDKLYRAELSFYITLSLLISTLLTIVLAIQKIKSSKKIKQIINGYVSYLNIISQLDSNRLRNNLSKINNYMVMDESFKDKKYFTELVDDVVRDTNNIRKTVKEGIIFQQTKRLKNVNVTTTN